MTLPIAEHREVVCRCGHKAAVLMWLAVDFDARDDLRAAFQRGEGLMSGCPECGDLAMRDTPLVILGLADAAPAVLAYSETLELDDTVARSDALLKQVTDALRHQHRVLPEPLYLPFDVLFMALARDVDHDAADPDTAVRWAASEFGTETAERYRTFLDDITASEPEHQLNAALDAINHVSDGAALERVLREYPVLLTEDARKRSAAIVQAVRARPADDLGMPHDLGLRVATTALELLERCAAGDIEGGWASRETALRDYESFLDSLAKGPRQAFDDAYGHDQGRAAEIGEQFLATIRELGAITMEVAALYNTATATSCASMAITAPTSNAGCELLERALMLSDWHPDAVEQGLRVLILMNLGAGVADRQRGDPAANLERAINLQRQALALVSKEEHGPAWATAHTNLGLSLLEREEFVVGTDDNTDEAKQRTYAALSEAIHNFEQALTWRSFARNPLDWAYTQINLAQPINDGAGKTGAQACA